MLLAIDTSTSWISLALFDGTAILYEVTWQSQYHHTIELTPAIQNVFEKTGIAPEKLSGLAVATGPGSFTSLRIGMAVVKGMSLALRLPVVGVPSLDIIAYAQPLDDKPMYAVLHAGRTRLACALYEAKTGAWEQQEAPEVVTPQELVKKITSPTLICGELSENARSIVGRRWKNAIIASPARCLRRASFLAEMGWAKLEQNQADDPVNLAPIYRSTSTIIPA